MDMTPLLAAGGVFLVAGLVLTKKMPYRESPAYRLVGHVLLWLAGLSAIGLPLSFVLASK